MGWPEEGSLDDTEWEYIFQRLLGRQAAASLRMKLKTNRLSWLISRTWCQGLLRVRELDSQVVKKEPRAEILGSGCGLTVSIMRKIKDVQGPGARPCVWRIRSLEKAALCLFR